MTWKKKGLDLMIPKNYASWKTEQALSKIRAMKRKAKRLSLYGPDGLITITGLKEKLWGLIKKYVPLRDRNTWDGKCLICRINPIRCAYHIIPAQTGSWAKWAYEKNIVGACMACNWGEVNNRIKYARKHVEIFGEWRMKELTDKSAVETHYSRADYLRMIRQIERKIYIILGAVK